MFLVATGCRTSTYVVKQFQKVLAVIVAEHLDRAVAKDCRIRLGDRMQVPNRTK